MTSQTTSQNEPDYSKNNKKHTQSTNLQLVTQSQWVNYKNNIVQFEFLLSELN